MNALLLVLVILLGTTLLAGATDTKPAPARSNSTQSVKGAEKLITHSTPDTLSAG